MKDLELIQTILGDIAVNEKYGIVMKKWRELFSITQSRLSKELNIKQSVISDYENNRRNSPGIEFIRKYTIAIVRIARIEHVKEYNLINNELGIKSLNNNLIKGVFKSIKNNKSVLKLLNATQVIAPEIVSNFNNYLFFSDNISNIITKKPSYDLIKGLTSKGETVFIFSKVKSGNVPLIILKILSKMNKIEMPKLIIFQSDNVKISGFTKKNAKSNNISIGITKMSNDEIINSLNVNSADIFNK